jgi:hypothetical protein
MEVSGVDARPRTRESTMRVVTSAKRSVPVQRVPKDPGHIHAWELRAVEYDSWGAVSLYECIGCPAVRYV